MISLSCSTDDHAMKNHWKPLVPLALLGLWTSFAPAQVGAAAKKDRDPEVVKLLKDLNDAVMDKKSARDEAAINLIDKLLTAAQAEGANEMLPKDKEAFVAALGDIFFKAKAREAEHKAIYETTSLALGRLGPAGGKILQRAFDDDKFSKKEWLELRGKFLQQMGRTKDEAVIPFLVQRVVRDTNDPILKAAGEALGNFDATQGKVRRDICKEMIKRLNEVHNQADKGVDPGDAQAKASRDTRAAILNPWNETLGKLTKQNFRAAPEWLHWWNKNKDADWDAKKKG